MSSHATDPNGEAHDWKWDYDRAVQTIGELARENAMLRDSMECTQSARDRALEIAAEMRAERDEARLLAEELDDVAEGRREDAMLGGMLRRIPLGTAIGPVEACTGNIRWFCYDFPNDAVKSLPTIEHALRVALGEHGEEEGDDNVDRTGTQGRGSYQEVVRMLRGQRHDRL